MPRGPIGDAITTNLHPFAQDKFWVEDPDGVEWEVYHVNFDLEEEGRERGDGDAICCASIDASCA